MISISQAVELWLADKAVLPIENSVGGSIHRNYDLLLRHRLHIAGEVQLIVNHCLLGLPGVRKEELKRVLSHPQVIIYSISLPQLHAKPRSTLLALSLGTKRYSSNATLCLLYLQYISISRSYQIAQYCDESIQKTRNI